MLIYPPSEEDLAKIFAIFRDAIEELPYYSAEAKRAYTKEFYHSVEAHIPAEPWLVAREQEIQGFATGREDHGTVWLDWIITDPAIRRHGVADQLLTSYESLSRVHGAHKLWFDSRTENFPCAQLFRKHHYKPITVLKDHWFHQDYFLWEKLL